jgi:hypothetical protein
VWHCREKQGTKMKKKLRGIEQGWKSWWKKKHPLHATCASIFFLNTNFHFQLPTSNFRLPTSDFLLPTSYLQNSLYHRSNCYQLLRVQTFHSLACILSASRSNYRNAAKTLAYQLAHTKSAALMSASYHQSHFL